MMLLLKAAMSECSCEVCQDLRALARDFLARVRKEEKKGGKGKAGGKA